MPSRDDKKLQESIERLKNKGAAIRFSVIGAGHGGLAMAGHLAITGFPVKLYNRTDDKLHAVRWHGGISVSGEVNGFGKMECATSDIVRAVENADVIMVVTPSTAHRSLADAMAPHLTAGQIVVLNPGRTGGALEFRERLNVARVTTPLFITETQTFIYASRATSAYEAHIHRIKNSVPIATLPAYWIPQVLAVLTRAYPQFVAGSNVLATSLENIGAVFHPALTIMNAGWIEKTHGDFDYYLDGITPSIAKVLAEIDRERVAVATALGIRSVSAREWLYLSYDSPGKDLYEAIHNTESYRGIRAPQNIVHRYIFEDIPMSLVPLSSIGNMLGVSTPMIDTVIRLGSLMHGVDYAAEGRNVERLGIAGMSIREIRNMVVGGAAGRARKGAAL
ncbi:MAG: NAD/NADP octopine/nopaline dehydrogenase family protein [Spirochaetes bacterium]|nr:NAD/NADP octopine/nopaline dehydrogenase family protein [Spirochaetota bacterium]